METPPPPGVDEHDLAAALSGSWGVEAGPLRYLPKGFGSYHWLAGTEGGRRWFLTVDDLDTKPWLGTDPDTTYTGLRAAYDTAAVLHDQAGLDFVVAPIVAPAGGATTVRLSERYSVSVFPFVEGAAGEWSRAVDAEERRRLVGVLADLHRSTAAVVSRAPRRDLEVPGRAGLEAALDELHTPWAGGPYSEGARRLLGTRAEAVRAWLGAFDDRVRRMGDVTDLVVSHGEPHPGNVMRAGGRVLLIDWDTVALAPAERDLWMLDDGDGGCLDYYTELTGRTVDPTAAALYRMMWTLSDIAAFTTQLRAGHEANWGTEKAYTALTGYLDGVVPDPYGLARSPHPPCGARGRYWAAGAEGVIGSGRTARAG